MSDNDGTSQCIEALCQLGCDSVRNTIAALEAGQPVAQMDGLDAEQRRRVLTELKAIMAVYDRG
ncbi:hypothetical protein [Sulfurivermis fontis]|uniref:hypothetical protein n=1 Tax=Sulfurivermis fontis TaxID=1972068 RepID=UPI000FDACC58|nr:hypothetical protein [Sulfurivermis fontis]